MSRKVYIRPLTKSDAAISCHWRNDPDIWKHTGNRPNTAITQCMEEEWIQKVLQNKNEKRFAICLQGTQQYIGNIQLTNIENESAQYHIFIGEKTQWGRGVAKDATQLILSYAFDELGLKVVYLEVKLANVAAHSLYKKIGFHSAGDSAVEGFITMVLNKTDFEKAGQLSEGHRFDPSK